MKQIKCSRCHCQRNVPDCWEFKECGKCHTRTERRYPKIREHQPRNFRVEELFRPFPSFEEYLAFFAHGRRMSKEVREKERQKYEQEKADHKRDERKAVEQAIGDYAHDKYPLRANECKTVRDKAIKASNEGLPNPIEVHNHIGRCGSCEGFVSALRRGEFLSESGLDPKETALQRKDEEEFAKGTGRQPQNEEGVWARYERMTVICPFCGSELIDGKCASCG